MQIVHLGWIDKFEFKKNFNPTIDDTGNILKIFQPKPSTQPYKNKPNFF